MKPVKSDKGHVLYKRPWNKSLLEDLIARRRSPIMTMRSRIHERKFTGRDLANLMRKSRRSLPRFLPRHGRLRIRQSPRGGPA